ncbi:MAG: hypothetical protein QOH33_959 [Paraburkholderia sp.]|nr:hypothetical protein [Paraburkholderia sp.]
MPPCTNGRKPFRGLPLAAAMAVAAALGLNGCAWTVFTAVDAAGSTVQAAYAVAANYSSPAFITGSPVAVSTVCIETNPRGSSLDLVPALQMALSRRGVNSDVYNPGASPAGCEALLTYSATVAYGIRSFGQQPTPYLSAINLTLTEGGRIVVSARYETQGLDADRYSSASSKARGLIDEMIVARKKGWLSSLHS